MLNEECKVAAELTIDAARKWASWTRRVLPAPERSDEGNTPAHALWMLGEIASGNVVGNKAQRWLGFAQGVLVALNLAHLHEMKGANRTASENSDG